MPLRVPSVSGHAFVRSGARGDVWYAKWRDAQGQHQKALGTVWPGNGPPPDGFLRPPRSNGDPPPDVAAELAAILTDARRGALEAVRTGVTFRDAAEEWLQHGQRERDWKRSTVIDYRSAVRAHLLPAFGSMPLERVTTRAIESWRSRWLIEHRAPRQAAKLVALFMRSSSERDGHTRSPTIPRLTLSGSSCGTTPPHTTSTPPKRSGRW